MDLKSGLDRFYDALQIVIGAQMVCLDDGGSRQFALANRSAAVMRIQAALALLPRSCASQAKAMPEAPPC